MERRRRALIAVTGVLSLLTLAARHPSIDLRVLTHDPSDLAPHRVQAAIDLGLMGVSLLVTWSGRAIAR